MQNTNTLVSSPNINGNIGSCEIKSTNIPITPFVTRTVAVNSCDGKIVGDYTHGDIGGYMAVVLPILFIVVIIGAMFSGGSDY